MDQSIQNFQELHINLCLNMHCLKDYLKTIGRKIKNNSRYFIVMDDGTCWTINPKTFNASFDEDDCTADGKIKYLPEISKYIKKIKIPNSVTSIGNYAFYYCSDLTNVTIPSSVTSIGDFAFYYCSRLTSVTIPDSVTSIGDSVFYKCSGLTDVTIGSGLTSIGVDVFYKCKSLKNIVFKNKTSDEVRRMEYYPWGIENESIIKVG